jgi:nitrous oxide reductase accessory protein NosL
LGARFAPRFAVLLALVLATLLASGCARTAGPPPIRAGATCAGCGMPVTDLRFACEREDARGYLVFDAIECLLRQSGEGAVYLTDYDSKSLHVTDSIWVVKGTFPSPMGGGLAAFVDRAAAEAVAQQTSGRVGRLRAFAAGATP